jgi:lipopolysaccharide export system permease protein
MGGQIVFARSYDARNRVAREVLWEREQGSSASERLTAQRLEWRGDRWVMFGGHRYTRDPGGPQVAAFDTLELASLRLAPADFASQEKKPEEMGYGELSAYIARAVANGEDATRNLVDLHLKVSFPFTCVVIVLLGAPLAANARHASLANSFGVGILICFAYYGGVKAGQALGWNKLLDPLLAAWAANLAFGVLGGLLLWRAHK